MAIKHRIECGKGHTWEVTPNKVVSGGKWCPHCAGNAKLTIEQMRELAKDRGGKCLSKKYTNVSTHLLWECSEVHRWRASPGKVKEGSWCQRCSHNSKLAA